MGLHRNRATLLLIGLLVGSVLLRLAAAAYIGGQVRGLPGTADQFSYHTLAQRVLNGHGFTFDRNWWPATPAGEPTAHWSYLYTFYLVGVYAVLGVAPVAARAIQVVLVGVLHPYLAYRIGTRIFGRQAGFVAALLTAAYAYFVYYSATLMTEPFYITSILASLFLSMQIADSSRPAAEEGPRASGVWLGLGLGLALGLAVLLRQLYLLIIPFLMAWILWAGSRRALKPVLLASGTAALMVLPFTLFNYAQFGEFVLLNTNAGFAFYWGNHPVYGTQFVGILPPEMGSYADLIPSQLRGLSEAAMDKALLQLGLGFVLEDPLRYVLLSISRIPVYFKFWPSAESGALSNLSRVASFGILWPFMLYGLFRSISGNGPLVSKDAGHHVLLLSGFITIYTLIHLLTWALIRYRLPVDAVLLVFGGAGLIDLAARFLAWRRRKPVPARLAADRT